MMPDTHGVNVAFSGMNARFSRGLAHHASTLFKRSAYEKVGGYRAPFYFAQDLDLWFRLHEIGRFAVLPPVLYQARIAPSTISGCYRSEQLRLTDLVYTAARLRRMGKREDDILREAARVQPSTAVERSRAKQAAALYFVGACLRSRNDARAKHYFKQAIGIWPMHLKSWYRYFL
ncbi:MAG: hypothetical protein R3F37_06925 [Candidatus Competibacteraceae bacterium]